MSPLVRRTWAPKGKTPVLKVLTRNRKKLSCMGALAVSPTGRRIRFMFRILVNGNFGAFECREFLKQLEQNISGRIILVWDGFQAHKSKMVKEYVRGKKRISIEFFPSYTPELNPVEFAWSHLKYSKMSNCTYKDLDKLLCKAKRSLCEMRKEKKALRGFVKHSSLRFDKV